MSADLYPCSLCLDPPYNSQSLLTSTNFLFFFLQALEVGGKTLLIDEDTCATNFMIRDKKMMELVHAHNEPITPFVKKVRSLYECLGVSSILVIGGSGDYFDVSDTVIMMTNYECTNVTERAKEIAGRDHDSASSKTFFGSIAERCLIGDAFRPNNKVVVRSKAMISYGDTELDLSGLEQVVGKAQTESIAQILQMIPSIGNADTSMANILSNLLHRIDTKGFDEIDGGTFNGGMAKPRIYEIAGAINRLRSGKLIQK